MSKIEWTEDMENEFLGCYVGGMYYEDLVDHMEKKYHVRLSCNEYETKLSELLDEQNRNADAIEAQAFKPAPQNHVPQPWL